MSLCREVLRFQNFQVLIVETGEVPYPIVKNFLNIKCLCLFSQRLKELSNIGDVGVSHKFMLEAVQE